MPLRPLAGADACFAAAVCTVTELLQLLGRAKMVGGRRGRGGGFRLSCDPEPTTLLDVVNVIDPLERLTNCPLGRTATKAAAPRTCHRSARGSEAVAD